MNKVLLVGRLVRDPETFSTQSGIKYSRFTIAISRPYGENQADYIPIVAWRNQADFIENYMRKGSLISVEGRFSSSTYQKEGQTITRYEVTADRVESLESRAQAESRGASIHNPSATSTQEIEFAKENQPSSEDDENNTQEVPWELEL